MHLTAKQIELLRVIATGNGPGEPCDLDEILERVRYETTKASLQFSIRALIKHSLIEKKDVEKRRGRQRRPIAITSLGLGYVGGARLAAPANPVISTIEDDDLDAVLEILES